MKINKQGILQGGILEADGNAKVFGDDIVIGENILKNSYFNIKTTVTDWDTNLNGNYVAAGWNGYNNGVTNSATVYHAHLVELNGEWVYNYTKDENNSWLGVTQIVTSDVTLGETYTFSCELYKISGTNYCDGGLYSYANSDATNHSFVTWFEFTNFKNAKKGQWIKYSSTMTIPKDTNFSKGCYLYIYGHSGGNGEFLLRRPKIEIGTKCTPWIPRKDDNIYATYNFSTLNKAIPAPIQTNEFYEI